MDSNYEINYTNVAKHDLERILDYLAGYGNPDIMHNFRIEIEKKVNIIRIHPYINMVALQLHEYKFRKLIIKGYIFIYYIDDGKKTVSIFRIFHELEDYENKLIL